MTPLERKVWCWCAHLAEVQADALGYAYPPREVDGDGLTVADHLDAAEGFMRRVGEVSDDEWQAALEDFWGFKRSRQA